MTASDWAKTNTNYRYFSACLLQWRSARPFETFCAAWSILAGELLHVSQYPHVRTAVRDVITFVCNYWFLANMSRGSKLLCWNGFRTRKNRHFLWLLRHTDIAMLTGGQQMCCGNVAMFDITMMPAGRWPVNQWFRVVKYYLVMSPVEHSRMRSRMKLTISRQQRTWGSVRTIPG